MSMTREEIIKAYEDAVVESGLAAAAGNEEAAKSYELFKAGLYALRPVSREQAEKVWSGCYMCDEYRYFMFNAWKDPNSSKRPDCMGTSMFCPNCGRPLTDEAVEITMRRLEALNEED